MNDYKPNSNRFKEEQKTKKEPEKKVEKVVTGKVVTRKKSGLSKFASEFIAEDAKNIKDYVIKDVLIPTVKDTISRALTSIIDMVFYGSSRGGARRYTADRVSYSNYYGGNNRPAREATRNTSYSYDDVILATRGEAEDVLQRMDELMESYGLVSVADLYDLVGVAGQWTDNDYGWTNIASAQVVRVRDGYMIKMPRAVPIN